MICRIEVEGVDRTGKDTLVGYLDYLSGRTMPVGSRGILSTMAYADLYNREIPNLDGMIDGNRTTLVVLLSANEEDLELRLKMSHHPNIDIGLEQEIFARQADILENEGIPVLRYNTSYNTPYAIAKEVISIMRRMNER